MHYSVSSLGRVKIGVAALAGFRGPLMAFHMLALRIQLGRCMTTPWAAGHVRGPA